MTTYYLTQWQDSFLKIFASGKCQPNGAWENYDFENINFRCMFVIIIKSSLLKTYLKVTRNLTDDKSAFSIHIVMFNVGMIPFKQSYINEKCTVHTELKC